MPLLGFDYCDWAFARTLLGFAQTVVDSVKREP
jgi:hypothetical protein